MKKFKIGTIVFLAIFSISSVWAQNSAAAKTVSRAATKATADALKKVSTPSNAVKMFYSAMAKADFAAAKKYVKAHELKKMIEALEELAKEMPEMKAEAAKDFAPMAQGKVLSEKITDNKAEVVYSYKVKEKNKEVTKKETYKLEKSGKHWIIIE